VGSTFRIVFPLAARSVPGHVFGAFYGVLYSIYLLRELHLDPFLLGIVISAGGVGSLVGSLFASRAVHALGIGRALVGTAIAASVIGVFILLMTVGVAVVARIFGLRLGPEVAR